MNISQLDGIINTRPIECFHPKNAPHINAACLYHYSRPPHRYISVSDRNRLLDKPPAIAWDHVVISAIERTGCTLLAVRLKTTGVTYFSTLENLYRNGRYQNRFGLQLVMTLKYWTVELPEVEQPRAPEPEQLTLFGGAL